MSVFFFSASIFILGIVLGSFLSEERALKEVKQVERKIRSIKVVAEATKPFIYIFEVGREFGGQTVDDIIEHDGVFKLFNRRDELITEINLPVVSVNYDYPFAVIN